MNDPKVAIVTGGNRGIGLEICRALARNGVHVVLGSRELAAGEQAAERLRQEGGAVEARALDVDLDASVLELASWSEERFGRVDILVNNAAILIDRVPTAMDLEPATLMQMLDTNVCGPLRLARAVAPAMRRSGHGRIVNMSSVLGQVGIAGSNRPAYRLTKLALNGLTRMLAEDLAQDRITVNAATPGWVRTRMGGDEAPRNAEQGADTPVWLALLPDDGPTGGLFMDRKPIPW